MNKCCMKLLGHVPVGLTPMSIREQAGKYEARWTAREVIQQHTSSWEYDDIEKSEKVEEGKDAPENPTAIAMEASKIPWATTGPLEV